MLAYSVSLDLSVWPPVEKFYVTKNLHAIANAMSPKGWATALPKDHLILYEKTPDNQSAY